EAVVADVTDEDAVRSAVARADASDAPLAAAVFNAGGNWPKRFLDMDRGFLEEMWRVNALAGFFFAKAAVSAGFAQAKAALRALAQSGAREFGPKGIHVAHVVVDGAIDGDRIHQFLPNLKEERGQDGLLDPDAIAENYWHLHAQARSAWTHELDVRPWVESW